MSQEGEKWICSYCTYENWPKSLKCTICLAQRPSNLISQEATNQGRDIYKMTPLITEASSEPSQDNLSSSGSVNPYNKWACHLCTYLNWPRAAKCTQCLTARKRSSPSCSSPSSPQLENISSERGQLLAEPETSTTVSDSYHNDRNKGWTRSLKWSCPSCTYENWPKSIKCVLCHTARPRPDGSTTNLLTDLDENRRRPQTSQGEAGQRLSPPGAHSNGNNNNNNCTTSGGGRRVQNNRCSEISEFQPDDFFTLVLSGVSHPIAKRVPSDVSRDVAANVHRHIASSLKQRKGEFQCHFVTEFVTFALPSEIEEFPTATQERLFDELLDRDVQKELEEESPIINWSLELTERLGSRLYALWNRSAGDCLLDSALQATWGLFDRENTLRRALGDSLCEAAPILYARWKEAETLQANLLHFTLDEPQWQVDWAMLVSLATQPGSALEQMHIFTLAHILRRPIIVYGVKYVKSFRGEAIGYARFEGIYLPLLWEPAFCWKSPIALGYTRGHFSALVPMEPDSGDALGAGANTRSTEDLQVVFLPLMTADHQLLPLHFLTQAELGREEEIMKQWLECCVTEGGILVAQQKIPKRPGLVAQMVEEWLDFYRSLIHRPLNHAPSPTSDSHAQAYSSDGDSDQE